MPLSEPVTVFILAVLQGVAEFLPISSSGHLVVVGQVLGSTGGPGLNVVLHFGTLLSILVFYRKRIIELLRSDRRVLPMLVLGTVPAAAIGLWVKKGTFRGRSYAWVLDDPLLAGFMLVATGFLLLMLERIRGGENEYQKIAPSAAIFVGLAQALALLPGVSRSGSTIVAGRFVGLSPASAATWSFLLAIPVIGGAMLLELKDIISGESTMETKPQWLFMGVVVAFVVGLFSLQLLVRILARGKLHWFAYWLLPFGMLVVVWQIHERAVANGMVPLFGQ